MASCLRRGAGLCFGFDDSGIARLNCERLDFAVPARLEFGTMEHLKAGEVDLGVRIVD